MVKNSHIFMVKVEENGFTRRRGVWHCLRYSPQRHCGLELSYHTCLITARVRSTREGNVLTRVCPSINLSVHRGGYPYPIMLCNISQNAMRQRRGGGGVPGQVPPGGVPGSGTPRGVPGSGTPPPGGYPGQVPPRGGTRVRYPRGGYPGQVPPLGGGVTRVGSTEGVLTTRRAVCLLRSRRRTFLVLIKRFPKINLTQK